MGRIAATDLMPDFAGRTLDHGRFQLLESLGSGAYGKVYRAIDTAAPPSTQRVFAVKCLNNPEPGSHTDLLQQREFAHHKLVSGHPNIVTFHHYFSDGLFVYVVLDLCSGGDLFAAITEKRIFQHNSRLIKQAFVQLIDAVQHCHDMGVFHRDIKPENVLCSNDGKDIKLADFGLSIMSPVCRDFGCGSSYYMSPECIGREITSGKYSTRHNDVWALGVILTNMITGRNPWRYATSEDECFSSYLHDNDFLRKVLPISPGANAILKSIFTINPLRRISLHDLRRDILEVDTFYAEEAPHKGGRSSTRKEVPVEPKVAEPERKVESKVSTLIEHKILSQSSDSLDERYIFRSPVVDHPPAYPPVEGSVQDQLAAVFQSTNLQNFIVFDSTDSLAVPSSASSGSSGPDSRGPITPATYAVDVEPPVDIPDIPEEEGLGPPVDLTNIAIVGKVKAATPIGKSRKPVDIFRSAVQRIKGLSAATSS